MAFNIVYNYHANDRFTAVSNKINSALEANKQKIKDLNKQLTTLGKGFKDVGKEGMLKLSAPILAAAGFALKASADLETMNVSFQSMLGSEEKANKMTQDLIKFSASTPFELAGIGAATKQLLAFGVTQEDMIGKLSFLGDIASGANMPLEDMAAIFGKSKAKGKAMTEELLQLSDRGIPIIDTLAKGLRISNDEVFELAKDGKISFEILEKAMISMTKKGGIFNDQMNKQSQTLAGRFSTLKDAFTNAMAAFGDEINVAFGVKDGLLSLTTAIEGLVVKFQALSPATKKWLIIGIALAAILPPIIFAIGTMITFFPIMIAGFTGIAAAVAFLAQGLGILLMVFKGIVTVIALLGGPVTAVILLVTALGALGFAMYENWKPFRDLIDSIISKAVAVGKIGGKILTGDFSGAAEGGLKLLSGNDVSKGQNSQSTVDVNLNAPAGVVRSVKSSSNGPVELNTGSNIR